MDDAGKRLRRARLWRGYESTVAFAAAVGVRDGTYQQHERNRGITKSAPKYAAALRVRTDWILLGTLPVSDNPADDVIADATFSIDVSKSSSYSTLLDPSATGDAEDMRDVAVDRGDDLDRLDEIIHELIDKASDLSRIARELKAKRRTIDAAARRLPPNVHQLPAKKN